MSQQNFELVRSAFEAWNRLDDEAILQLFSPNAELDASGRILNPDIYAGIDGLMQFRRDIADNFFGTAIHRRRIHHPATEGDELCQDFFERLALCCARPDIENLPRAEAKHWQHFTR